MEFIKVFNGAPAAALLSSDGITATATNCKRYALYAWNFQGAITGHATNATR